MKIHEYQAKEIFRKYNVPTPKGKIAYSVEEAVNNAKELAGPPWVVKAQIHAGGRGKGGGVKLAKTIEEVKELSSKMLGMTLVTHQTGPAGKLVRKVYIEEGASIKDELYFSVLLDREKEIPVIMASTEGGMDIEKVAAETPEKIVKVHIDPATGFMPYHGRELAFALKLSKEEQKDFIKFAKLCYDAYLDLDAELIEINPLIKTTDNKFIALDAKMGFDDNALMRHKNIEELRDLTEEDPAELEAKKYGLNYISLDGEIACMVNGAGLAMGTMDTINYYKGSPANFLDVGGKASAETVAKGFEIILRNKKVKAIFINIFGGIVRCDRIANGILEASKMANVEVPVVVRLDGTNSKEASEILNGSNLKNIITADNLADGAIKAVKASKGEI